jgi:hypothetical protein
MKMRIWALASALAVTATLAAAGVVKADTSATNNAWSASVGAYLPSNGGSKVATAIGELNYQLPNKVGYADEQGTLNVTVGYTNGEGRSIWPITISDVVNDTSHFSKMPVYYGLGVGDYITKMSGSTETGTKNLLGGFVVVGTKLSANLFLQGKYNLVSKYGSEDPSGYELTIGTTF